jgi:hypothetical protein
MILIGLAFIATYNLGTGPGHENFSSAKIINDSSSKTTLFNFDKVGA